MKRACHVLMLAVCCALAWSVIGCSAEPDVTTTSTTTGPGAWTNLEPRGDLPSARNRQAMAYDSRARGVILFGGLYGTARLDDTWTYDLEANTWRECRPSGESPSARFGHAMAYEAAGDRVILFGGYDGSGVFDDTWAYDLTADAWTRLVPGGSPPPPRYGHAMVYDPAIGRVILFGGLGGDGRVVNDIWAYDPAANAWTELHPGGDPPPARYGHAMACEPASGRLIIHDGCDASGAIFDDIWAYDPATNAWIELEPRGEAPPARDWHSMVFDSASSSVIMFGGWSGSTVLKDLWAYDPVANAWNQLSPTGASPPARDLHCLVYDLSGARVILFGGFDGVDLFNDIWAYGREP